MLNETLASYSVIFPHESDELNRLQQQAFSDTTFRRSPVAIENISASAIVLSPDRTKLLFARQAAAVLLQPTSRWQASDASPLETAYNVAETTTGVTIRHTVDLAVQDPFVPLDIHIKPLPTMMDGDAAGSSSHHYDLRYVLVAASEKLSVDDSQATWIAIPDVRFDHLKSTTRKLRELKIAASSLWHV